MIQRSSCGRDVGSWVSTDMHLDNYEIQKNWYTFLIFYWAVDCPIYVSKAEISSLSNIRDMEFEIWYSLLHLERLTSFSNLNRWSSFLGLFYHAPLKRDQDDWDCRLRFNDSPNVLGCITTSNPRTECSRGACILGGYTHFSFSIGQSTARYTYRRRKLVLFQT